MPVAGIAGIGQQPFVAGIHQHAERQQQCAGRAGRDHDPCRRDVESVARVIEAADRFAELVQPKCRRVMHVSAGEETPGRFKNGIGRREVGFANLQVNDRPAFGFERLGARHQLHDMKWRDLRHPCSDVHTVLQ